MSAPPPSLERAWIQVSGEVLAGLCHDLNDRIATLGGMAYIARGDGEMAALDLDRVDDELERLRQLVHLVRQLAPSRNERPEPLLLQEVAPLAADLLRRQPGLEEIELEDSAAQDAPPVRARWSALLQGMLVLFSVLARSVGRHGRPRLEISAVGVGRHVTVDIAAGVSAAARPPVREPLTPLEPPDSTSAIALAEAVVSSFGGTVLGAEAAGEGATLRVEFRCPTIEAPVVGEID